MDQCHCRHEYGADVEQTAILRKISSLQFLPSVETNQTSSDTLSVFSDGQQN